MEQLKTLEEISQPDSRNLNYVIVDPETGEHRRYSLQDAHAAIREIELAEEVPDDIRDHFQTARHLLLYSWFVYRFVSVAQMQAFASLEYALRVRLGYRDQQRPYLTQLLEEAVRQGAFRDDKFRDWPGHCCRELIPASGHPGAWPGRSRYRAQERALWI